MTLSYLLLGILFFIQTGVGILGNFFLLGLYTFTLLNGHKLRPIEYIFAHLASANSKVLLSKGIPQMIVCLGFKNFLDPIGCKFIVYLYAVARSVSLSMTCLLSGFQVITISPSNSWWAELKIQAPKCILPSCFLCWCFYLLINCTLLGTMHNSRYRTNNTKIWQLGYCSILTPASFNAALFAIIFSMPDVLCMGFMICSSAYLVLLLHRHHQQVQHIHSPHLSPRIFPEKRATQAILLLVITYVSFYSINSSLSFYQFKINKHPPWFTPTLDLLAAYFPAISPFVLIFSDSQVLKYWYALWHRRHCCLLCHTVHNHTHFQNSSLTL
ncbi:vomeronasal type-1 receptor 1-like [Phascolarctos cinereus]|uniref:Vomeronasal type-1 receptor n=1 Tax=Phascolarctos cinereus TaxID=38626 RepID=A0A6P5LQM7_PHACI|nr:vomeronasal type-1 receptor 1-like [Phascolarctos cinereus]